MLIREPSSQSESHAKEGIACQDSESLEQR